MTPAEWVEANIDKVQSDARSMRSANLSAYQSEMLKHIAADHERIVLIPARMSAAALRQWDADGSFGFDEGDRHLVEPLPEDDKAKLFKNRGAAE